MSRGRSGAAAGGSAGDTLDPEAMRALVRQYSDLGQWTGALFWADKALALRGGCSGPAAAAGADGVWLVAQCLTARGEWHRAVHAVTSRELHKSHLLCLHAAARALLAAKEPAQALQLLSEVDPDLLEHTYPDIQRHRALAGVYVCKGAALSALERRGVAVEALVTALRHDVCCYEALDMLLEHHDHTLQQDEALLESLAYDAQCGHAEAALLRELYRARTDRYGSHTDHHSEDSDAEAESGMRLIRAHSTDVVSCRARRLLHRCEFAACLRLLDSVDPWCCAELRVACLVELKRAPALFAFAHTLVDRYPHSATAWFAVGCYYFLIGKNEFARRYLAKAKSLEPGMGCVWLAYGHSFAADNEHDQAMAAYFKASQLLPGCHLPYLYISVECSLLNNAGMTERFLARAAGLSTADPHQLSMDDKEEERTELARLAAGEGVSARLDPHVTHEAGAAAFATGKFRDAELLFRRALQDVQAAYSGDVPERWHALLDNLGHACRKNGKYKEALTVHEKPLACRPAYSGDVPERWHALLDNLGHACRKNGKYKEALTFHEKALACRPGHGATYAAMGFCLALLGQTERAVDVFHAALARDPDDAVSLSMLNYLIDQLMEIVSDEPVPQFPFPAVTLELPVAGSGEAGAAAEGEEVDITTHSDMSMSFD